MDHEDYSDILEDIIDCCFYSNVKPRIKISHFRQLTEVLIRKLLSIDKNKKIMLGNSDLKEKLAPHFAYDPKFESAYNTIKSLGNDYTHTERLNAVSTDEYNQSLEATLYVYSYLFIDFFHKEKFNDRKIIVAFFSILPPEIRVNTLTKLLENSPNDVFILNKLALARLKQFGLKNTVLWLHTNKETFDLSDEKLVTLHMEKSIEKNSVYSTEIILKHIKNNLNIKSLFEYILNTLITTQHNIDREGHRYKTFESAKEFYSMKKKELNDDSKEFADFIELMDLCYTGRKKEENKNALKSDNAYITIR
ncbi:hypothetical protein DNK65_17915 [Citrobacter koseri]|uniref:DUF4145 domain-containing protein n=1 Tax=Citrobacter koseri TaxID=545 RepID=UPI000D7C8E5B|nr:DUF4145 domain-containing protein [Citrobacter koseri]PYZ79986.1 hypothetical protein DNK65_17915 [Citrobacter koseri]